MLNFAPLGLPREQNLEERGGTRFSTKKNNCTATCRLTSMVRMRVSYFAKLADLIIVTIRIGEPSLSVLNKSERNAMSAVRTNHRGKEAKNRRRKGRVSSDCAAVIGRHRKGLLWLLFDRRKDSRRCRNPKEVGAARKIVTEMVQSKVPLLA